jgi:hypothetical protein
MATVTVTSSPVTLDGGTAYELFVVNDGTVDVYVSRGQQSSRMRAGQSLRFQPEGQAVTAQVMGSTNGQVTMTATAPPSSHGSLGTDGHLYPA